MVIIGPLTMSSKIFSFLNLLKRRLKSKFTLLGVLVVVMLYLSGIFLIVHEESFENFQYPPLWDVRSFIEDLVSHNKSLLSTPLQNYSIDLKITPTCPDLDLRVVFIVKSAITNFHRRAGIRKTWGFEARFSDVPIRTVFVLGSSTSPLIEAAASTESKAHGDIILGSFIDNYYNNTLKTITGISWARLHCRRSRFFVFSDDDMYVSAKNILRFLHGPYAYPDYLKTPFMTGVEDVTYKNDVELYAGYKFTGSRPFRQPMSKWYVSLEEYPYDEYPPYVTAGLYIVSKRTLFKLYYGALLINYFRFDDIYLSILSKKLNLTLTHCDEVHFNYKPYNKRGYRYVVASHGYGDPDELERVWNEQKRWGNS